MRTNGTMRYEIVLGGGGRDEYGEVVAAVSKWSDPIPCLIKTTKDNRLEKYEDGEYHGKGHVVFIERPEMTEIASNRISLVKQGVALGEYRIASQELASTFDRLKIIV